MEPVSSRNTSTSLTLFPRERYKKGKQKLGKGGQGSVRVYEKITSVMGRIFGEDHLPDKVAVKKIDGIIASDQQLMREVSFLEKSDHPNIVKYFGYFAIGDKATGIAMEICEGTVKDLVMARDLDWLEVAYLSHQMLRGLEYLHDDLKLHHRDIKPGNLLLKTRDGESVLDWSNVNVFNLILKISDFGLCRQLSESRASESIVNTVVGSVNWLAPEVKTAMLLEASVEAPYSKYSDIWGCGCVAYYMVKKKPPDNSDVINDCEKLRMDDSLKKFQFIDFLLSQLQTERKQRLSAKLLLREHFLALPVERMIVEAQILGNMEFYETLNAFCSFSSSANLKCLIGGLRVELDWNEAQIATYLLQGRFSYLHTLEDLLNIEAIVVADILVREGKLDAANTDIQKLLTEALFNAVDNGKMEKVKLLCENGTTPNVQRDDGDTALHRAGMMGHYQIVEYLIKEANANMNMTDSQGDAVLHKAAWFGHTEIVKLLCESGAETKKAGWLGQTALHKATMGGHISIVKYLIETVCADVNATDLDGETPLHKAAGEDYPEIVRLLLTSGADIEKRNRFNETALYLAGAGGHYFILNLLLERGADSSTIKDSSTRTVIDTGGLTDIVAHGISTIVSYFSNILTYKQGC